jgi:hypothetical protein
MKLLLSVLLLSASALPAAAHYCAPSPDFEGRTLVLWVTDKTNPDEAPCLARLAYAKCEADTTPDGVTPTGSLRYFGGKDVSALLAVADDGAVTVSLRFAGALGVASGVSNLGTYPYQRALYRGIGVDKASVYDLTARSSRVIGNVFLIPAENLTPRALALCPAN